MKIIFEEKINFPTYYLSYIINDDASGLSEEEKIRCDNFLSWYYNEAKKLNSNITFCVDNTFESFFSWNPAIGLACDCIDLTIIFLK